MDRPTARITFELDRSNPVPLYFQMARHIEAAIEAGELQPGSRLENEAALSEQYGLARPTVRRAIEHLVDKGLLVRKRGVGTQVVHGKVKRAAKLTSLYEDLVKAGQTPATKVLKLATEPASADVAGVLDLAEGDDVVALERLRGTDDGPLAILRNWLPGNLPPVTAHQLESGGLFQVLRANGTHLRVASQQISARTATAAESRLLEIRRGAAVLTMTRTTYDDVGRAVEYGLDVYRADRYSYEMTLTDR